MTVNKSIRMNVDLWTYEDYVEYVKAYQSGNKPVITELARKLIVSWDYDTSLSNPEAILELGVAESAAVFKTVWEVINVFAEDMSISDVRVDFGKWNTRTFFEFDDARAAGNWRKAEKMLHEIAWMDGVSPEEQLSFKAGAAMYKAANEAYKKIISGKN